MRLTALILIAAIHVHATGSSQISISEKNAPLERVFKAIEKQTGYVFFYDLVCLQQAKTVSIKVKNAQLDEVLIDCFRDQPLTYIIVGKTVVVKQKEEIKINIPTPVEKPLNQNMPITGTVTDDKGQPLAGVTIMVKGAGNGTNTDANGRFSINVEPNSILTFSYIGFENATIKISNQQTISVKLIPSAALSDAVVVVGYGSQKKASVVGSISTTSYKELQRSGGVNNLAMALTGRLPGLTTIQITGQPGKADPKIYIRGQGTWNGGQPYILVDGVERRMNDLDMSEVDNISVLKDASATAVFGVKGANGVILISTKRGTMGKPQLTFSTNSTVKWSSRLMSRLDAYDALSVKNSAIEREVPLLESMWGDYTPLTILQRYRNPDNYLNLKYPEAFPNVDWAKETVKPYAMDNRINLNVSGGTNFVKYFTSLAYTNEGDLLKSLDNGKGYKPGFGFNKYNFRTNLDISLTKTTSLKFNLAGIFSEFKTSRATMATILSGLYGLVAPNVFLPRYADGRWGQSLNTAQYNAVALTANSGYDVTNGTDLTADIGINQKLNFITQGLSFSTSLSFDNHFDAIKSITDGVLATKWINPLIEDMPAGGNPNDYVIIGPVVGTNQFAWVPTPWSLLDENADGSIGTLRRRMFYQAQLNYTRGFGKHDLTATGVFTREQLATGSEFQRYREDWVGRATYNYDNRFFAEFNGAYNGSEKFGPNFRFAFFPSGAVGWTISNEQFMKRTENWLDKLKLRYSFGKIGDDGGLSQRWMYATQWNYGGNNGGQLPIGQYYPINAAQRSPYIMSNEAAVGNPNIQWETVKKSNWGLEIAVLKNMFSGSFEYFAEDRTNIMLAGSSRVIPPYFGTEAPTANVGRVIKKGYEIQFRFNKDINKWHLWAETNTTHVVDKVMDKEEPSLKDPHLLAKGFQIDQTRSLISTGFIQNWNQIYGTAPTITLDNQRLPGNYNLLDFDGDGIIDAARDIAPYGYSNRPQNDYNLTLGADYKGWSFMLQLYGVTNVTRYSNIQNFGAGNQDNAYGHALNHWSIDNPNAPSFLPRWKTQGGQNTAQYFQFDGSYLRFKTAEVAYTLKGERLRYYGMSSLKLYINGNNLYFWSKMPDDREQPNLTAESGFDDRIGAYPTAKRINLGVDIKF